MAGLPYLGLAASTVALSGALGALAMGRPHPEAYARPKRLSDPPDPSGCRTFAGQGPRLLDKDYDYHLLKDVDHHHNADPSRERCIAQRPECRFRTWRSTAGVAAAKKKRAVKLVGLSAIMLLAGGMMVVPPAREAIGGSASGLLKSLQERFAGSVPMAKPDPVRGVRVFTVANANTVLERSFTGTVAARYETAIGFRVGGKILKRALRSVRRSALAILSSFWIRRIYRSAVSAAEATLLGAQAQAAQAVADERRQAQLLTQGWTTQAAYDRAKARRPDGAEPGTRRQRQARSSQK